MISALILSSLLGAGPLAGTEVEGALQTLRRSFLEEGPDRVARTATHRVISHQDGSLELQGEQPLRISLQSVQRERGAPCRAELINRRVETTTVTSLRACGVEERWTNERPGLAHAFVVQQAPPGAGGLTVRLAVEGPWHHHDDRGHVFKGPGSAALLRYGNAFVVREGQRVPIDVVHVEGGLELRVPRALVEAKNAFPMTIDPLLSAEVPLDPVLTFNPPPTSEEQPAIAVNGVGVAMVVWVDGRRQVSTDIFGARLNNLGMLIDAAGLPIAVGPGNQQRPTICATGNSFFVAWDSPLPDGGLQVKARPVSAAGALGAEFDIGPGSQPSVTNMNDAGVYLALVDTNSIVQIIPIRGNVVGPAVARSTSGNLEFSAHPVIASYQSTWFAAWEGTVPGDPFSLIKGMFSGEQPREIVLADLSLRSARRVSAALSPGSTGVEAHVFWEEGADVHGKHLDINSSFSSSFDFVDVSSPAVVSSTSQLGARPVLGVIAGNSVRLIDLNDGGVSGFMVGPRSNELVLAKGAQLFGAWTESPFAGGDVRGAVVGLVPANTTATAVSRAATAQRGSQVALRDGLDEGLAVWVEGSNRIRCAKVRVDANGLTVGLPYTLLDLLSPIEHLEVTASGSDTTYLVSWRTLAGSVSAQLVTVSSGIGSPSTVSQAGANAGPAVAWDAQNAAFVIAWSRAESFAFEVMSRTMTQTGMLSIERRLAPGEANELALTCLSGQCLVAYERPNQIVEAVLIDFQGVVMLVRTQATQPAVAHDGQNFFVGWRADNTLKFAQIDAVTALATDLQSGPRVSSSNTVGRFSMASAQPPVVSWSELSADEVSNVYFNRIDFQGVSQHVALGFAPSVSATGAQADPRGVVVYQRYVAADGLQTVRAFGRTFSYSVDAGAPDAGGPDAGSPDAGPGSSDAGVDGGMAADGGPMIFETTGCTCQSGSPGPLVLLLGLLALRRRRPA